jgi:GrpB-like predicted nucleotidyltransferase (UPF0157 family)
MESQVDEPVHPSEPSQSWVDAFETERARIQHRLSLPVEHIGSTSVPGLLAKPIVDIQIGIPVLDTHPLSCRNRLGVTQPHAEEQRRA